MRHILLGFGLLMTLSLACQALTLPSNAGQFSTPSPLGGFEDDFSNPLAHSWDTASDSESTRSIESGSYRIRIAVPQRLVWSTPRQYFTDGRIEVDATKAAGPDSAEYGVICRYAEDPEGSHSFYYLVVAGSGHAKIVRVVANEQSKISASEIPLDAVRGGDASNHLMAECIGNRLSLYANGIQLLTEIADGPSSGDVGIIATTYEQAGIDVRFDNFVVRQP
jgi:hypothetical protein